MKKQSRRDFIIKSGALGLSLSVPFNAFSNQNRSLIGDDHFFILIQVSGGMDVTLGLDPLTHMGTGQKDVFLEYRPEDIIRSGNISFGPSAASLAAHAQDLSIVNGIVMRRDVGHESLRNYISTGTGDGSSAFVGVEFDRLASKLPLGILVNQSISTGRYQPTLSRIDSFLANAREPVNPEDISFLNRFYKGDSALSETQQNYLRFKSNQLKFTNALNGVVSSLGVEKDEAAVLAAAFLSSSAKTGALNLTNILRDIDLDTHSNHEGRHLESQKKVWDYISELFSLFKRVEYKSGNLFDKTTFMVTTEFSRTPFLNPAKGKDHNVYTNSVLLAGKGVNGGNVIGGSHVIPGAERGGLGQALHIGSPLDYKTGLTVNSSNGTGLIFPENLVKSLHQVFGVNKDQFYPEISGVKTIPGLGKL